MRRQLPARLLVVGAYRSGEVTAPDHPLLALKQDLQIRGRSAELALEPLPGRALGEYFAARFAAGKRQLTCSLQHLPELVHARTGGHPLFMAAVTDDLVRRGAIVRRRGRWAAPEAVREVQLPVGVRQFIGQEIDRFGPEQQHVLEAASVAGLEFSTAAVAAALDADAEVIEACCTDLARHQRFLRPAGVGVSPDGTVAARFAFRHDLYLEAASERLGASRRRALHLRLGEWQEHTYGERAQEIAAVLAVHFEEAGDWLRAARYRRLASEQARRRHAPREASEHARRGVIMIERERPSPERIREELLLQQALAVGVTTTKGFAAPELSTIYARASELCEEVEDFDSSVSVLCGLWNLALNRGDCRRASDVADQLLSLGQQRRQTVALLHARDAVASTRFFMGEPAAAVFHCERGLELYDIRRHRHLADVYGDPGVLCHVVAGLAHWLLGNPDRARRHVEEGLRLSHELGYPFVLAQALWHGGIVYQHCGGLDQAQDLAEALIRLCRQRDIGLWLGSARILRGWTLMQHGRAGPGLVRLRRGLDQWRATGTVHHLPHFLGLLTQGLTYEGATEAAWSTVEEAQAIARISGEQWYEAELHRLSGELAWSAGQIPLAESWFQSALEIARRQGARSWELRAAASLARLWRDQGSSAQAYNLLAPVYQGFTEGFDTADLTDAKDLLNTLGEPERLPAWNGVMDGASRLNPIGTDESRGRCAMSSGAPGRQAPEPRPS